MTFFCVYTNKMLTDSFLALLAKSEECFGKIFFEALLNKNTVFKV